MTKGMKQKFHRGDLVHIVADLGPHMSNFTANVDALVIGSYADEYPNFDRNNISDYSLLLLDDSGNGLEMVAWYEEWQLMLIEKSSKMTLKQLERDLEDFDDD